MSTIKQKILGLIGNRMFLEAHVVSAATPAPRFRVLELQSDALAGKHWEPGSKIQVNIGAWETRTYTPVPVDVPNGRFRVMAWLHGAGPGAKWANAVRTGERIRFFGPRASLRGPDDTRPLVVHGDETAIAMAATFLQARGGTGVHAFIEAEDPAHAEVAARAIGLENARFFPKGGDRHAVLEALARAARNDPHAGILLAGHAQSIRDTRVHLRGQGVSTARLRIKVYWADGRAGLD